MILDGKIVAKFIYEDLKNEISVLKNKPKLCVILVWNNASSLRYISQKQKWSQYVWIDFELIHLDENTTQNDLLEVVEKLNCYKNINWFMVQTPLPKHINTNDILNSISPKKDVDGFHPLNQWKIVINDFSWLTACTPLWIMEMFRYYNIDVIWKNIVVIWRSNIVWKPIANILINNQATVTICNSKTKNIDFFTKNADIIITAMWVPKFLTVDKINKDAVIIDVWFTVIDDKIYGDCDFENIIKNWNSITPVPGWVWALTVAGLLKNTLTSYKNNL